MWKKKEVRSVDLPMLDAGDKWLRRGRGGKKLPENQSGLIFGKKDQTRRLLKLKNLGGDICLNLKEHSWHYFLLLLGGRAAHTNIWGRLARKGARVLPARGGGGGRPRGRWVRTRKLEKQVNRMGSDGRLKKKETSITGISNTRLFMKERKNLGSWTLG